MPYQREIWNYPRNLAPGCPPGGNILPVAGSPDHTLNLKCGGPTPGSYTENRYGEYTTSNNAGDWAFHHTRAAVENLPPDFLAYAQVDCDVFLGGVSTGDVFGILESGWPENPVTDVAFAGHAKIWYYTRPSAVGGNHMTWILRYTDNLGNSFYWNFLNNSWGAFNDPNCTTFASAAAVRGPKYDFWIERRADVWRSWGRLVGNPSGAFPTRQYWCTDPIANAGIQHPASGDKLVLGDPKNDRLGPDMRAYHVGLDYGRWRVR